MTTNEMIYKTITTKLTKEPTYKTILEDMGYEVYDSTWSEYNNWAIKNPKTGRTVLFSKGYDNKRRLYDIARPINANNFKLVDYVGLLNKKPYVSPCDNRSEYNKLKDTIGSQKFYIKCWERDIRDIQKKIDALIKDVEKYKGYITRDQKILDDARQRVLELKAK